MAARQVTVKKGGDVRVRTGPAPAFDIERIDVTCRNHSFVTSVHGANLSEGWEQP